MFRRHDDDALDELEKEGLIRREDSFVVKVAEASERDVESAVLGLTSLIEPAMIVTMGLVVGLIVLSILLPIFEMNQLIG